MCNGVTRYSRTHSKSIIIMIPIIHSTRNGEVWMETRRMAENVSYRKKKESENRATTIP